MPWDVEYTDEFGDKTGDNRWYEKIIPVADALYAAHLTQLKQEGLNDG